MPDLRRSRPRHTGTRAGGRPARVLAALLVATATGCATVPTDGPVTRVRDAVDAGDPDRFPDSPVRPLVKGPDPGAEPEAVVRGFLDAHADPRNDHDVARLYLAGSATWSDRGVTIFAGERTVAVETAGSTAVATVRAERRGAVTARGEFRPASGPLELRLDLARVEGEWRLTRVPQGLLLAESKFRTGFRRATVYYPDLRRERLVPDSIFLPEARSLVPEAVAALLAGPTDWLAGAVRSAVPAGTRLVSSPTVIDGIAQLNFSRELATTPKDVREVIAAQIVWTLTEPGLGVTAVRLLVEGRPLEMEGFDARAPQDRSVWRHFDPQPGAPDGRLYFVHDGRLYSMTAGAAAEPVRPDEAGVQAAAFNARERLVGVVVAAPRGRRTLLVGPLDGDLRSGVTADRLTDPTWGVDAVWTVRGGPGRQEVVAVPIAALQPQVIRAEIGPEPVTTLLLSPEGARAAVVAGGRLRVARIEAGVRLGGFRDVVPGLVDVTAVAWADASRFLVVARPAPGSRPRLYEVDMDGYGLVEESVEGLPSSPDAIAARTREPVVVEVDGVLYRRAGAAGWSRVGPGSKPTYAG